MKKLLIILLFAVSSQLLAQINLTIEGVDSITAAHNGYEIARTSQTNLIFRYSRIRTAINDGYMLMAGDNDYTVGKSTNLDGAQIYGNRFMSSNTTPSGSVHGTMVGYNRNYDIHHNYVTSYKYGVTHEGGHPDHTSMTSTSGGVYYNIFKNNTYSLIEKGYDGTRVINNTFYTNLNSYGYFINVRNSHTGGITEPYPPSANVKIYNNIFFNDGPYIDLSAIDLGDELDTVGFRCDYNIYWYSQRGNNEPVFAFRGSTLTWTQWRALGYDAHSVIMNPNFGDTDEFVPTTRIDHGIAVTGFETGLSAENTTWTVGQMPETNTQGSTWQPGARIYETVAIHEADYYVSTTGNDSNPGTYELPWATWQKAFDTAQAGDTVYFRGGVYYTTAIVMYDPDEDHGYSGTMANPICFFNYPGEVPILDGVNKRSNVTNSDGLAIWNVKHAHFKGLTIRNHPQVESGSDANGFSVYESSVILENCVSHNNGYRGFWFNNIDTVSVINCDAYNNADSLSLTPGNAGDGFIVWSTHLPADTMRYITFSGCRSWHNSDDGWDVNHEGYVELDNCWSWGNGYLSNGDGCGFKLSLTTEIQKYRVHRKLFNSVSAYNKYNGITTNDRLDLVIPMNIYNNTSYKNGEFGIYVAQTLLSEEWERKRIFRNNIVFENVVGNIGNHEDASYTHEYNSWNTPPGVTITNADFLSIDSTGITATRQVDGSFPNNDVYNNFLKLIPESDLIDAGTDVGISFYGEAPDLGYDEYDGDPSPSTEILSFMLADQTGPATINATAHTVTVEVAYTADVSNLTPTITLSYGATVIPLSGVARDFTNPVPYTVTAEDGVTHQEWTVTVTQEATPEPDPPVSTGQIVKFNGKIVKR